MKNSIIQVDEPEMEVDDEELVVNMLAVNDILHRGGGGAAEGREGLEDTEAEGEEAGAAGGGAGGLLRSASGPQAAQQQALEGHVVKGSQRDGAC